MRAQDSTATEQARPEHPRPSPAEADVEVEASEPVSTSEELDDETRARRDAALAQVRKLGDPVLRASAVAVDRFDDALRAEVGAWAS